MSWAMSQVPPSLLLPVGWELAAMFAPVSWWSLVSNWLPVFPAAISHPYKMMLALVVRAFRHCCNCCL